MALYTQERLLGSYSSSSFHHAKWNRQPKPYIHALPYWATRGATIDNTYGITIAGSTWVMSFSSLSNSDRTDVENIAAERLLSSISDKANIAVDIAERRQSINMIAKRCGQLVQVARDLRKGRFIQAAKRLGIKKPKNVSRSKQFADNWLEYHFGWAPLIGDIFTAGDILQQPVKRMKARGRAHFSGELVVGSYPYMHPGQTDYYSVRSWSYRVVTGCRITSINPDVWLMNQLGLINPAVVAWETVPFSFVVDWFTGFGSYLEGLTATVGLTIEDGYTTRHLHASGKSANQYRDSETGIWKVDNASGYGDLMERSMGILTSKPNPRFFRFSPTRGITAVSLLLQQLSRIK